MSVVTAQYLGQSDPDEFSAFSLGSTTRIRHINISGLGAGSGSSTLFSFPCLLPLHLPGVFFYTWCSRREKKESGRDRDSPSPQKRSCHRHPPSNPELSSFSFSGGCAPVVVPHSSVLICASLLFLNSSFHTTHLLYSTLPSTLFHSNPLPLFFFPVAFPHEYLSTTG